MTSDVDAANAEIAEQAELLEQIVTALEGKVSGGGVTLPDLNNPASASDILSGKAAIDEDGNKITGTIATKTSSNLTASGAIVTVPAGYYATNATKSVATATQATPSVSINSSGLITASATQTAGYVSAGTKSDTKQMTTQAAKTITPSTSSQTAVAKNVYTTGVVTVGAIPSNYEDVSTETISYTTKLASLETAITALETELEGKASGGSGGGNSNGYCNITVSSDYASVCDVFCEGENGWRSFSAGFGSRTVKCGSLLFVSQSGYYSALASSGEILCEASGIGFVYQVPNTPDVTITIDITTD
jgi:hypothetical protein